MRAEIPVSYTHLDVYKRQVLRCHFFVSARNNIKTLYQISLAKACFLLYNIDTGEPRMQHPWRQREHPFSSDLIALTFWFSQCTRYWLRADATLSVSAVCHPCPMAGSPYACCAPSSAAPVPVPVSYTHLQRKPQMKRPSRTPSKMRKPVI